MFAGGGDGPDHFDAGRAGAEHRGDARVVEEGDVGFRHDAPDDHGGACGRVAQCGDHSWCDGEVRAVVHRDADDIDVLVARDRGDGLGRLAEPAVDDLHARVAQRARHHLDAAVVAVEPDLGDEHPAARAGGQATARSTQVPNTSSSAAVTWPTVTCAVTASRIAGT